MTWFSSRAHKRKLTLLTYRSKVYRVRKGYRVARPSKDYPLASKIKPRTLQSYKDESLPKLAFALTRTPNMEWAEVVRSLLLKRYKTDVYCFFRGEVAANIRVRFWNTAIQQFDSVVIQSCIIELTRAETRCNGTETFDRISFILRNIPHMPVPFFWRPITNSHGRTPELKEIKKNKLNIICK